MKRPSRKSHRAVPPFDLTPMIDVVFQLIIFFLFTSQFGELVRTEIDLPQETGETAPATEGPNLIIDIAADGTYFMASEPRTLADIEAIARGEIGITGDPILVTVLLRPDRNGPAIHLNELTQTLSQLGIRQASIGTVTPSGTNGAGNGGGEP
ncbi:MAG: biopolymer transport protein ExbD [Phycisphaerales bacterium]